MLSFINFLADLFTSMFSFVIDSAEYILCSIQFIIMFPITIMDIILNLTLPSFFIYGLITFVVLMIIIITFKILSWFL